MTIALMMTAESNACVRTNLCYAPNEGSKGHVATIPIVVHKKSAVTRVSVNGPMNVIQPLMKQREPLMPVRRTSV